MLINSLKNGMKVMNGTLKDNTKKANTLPSVGLLFRRKPLLVIGS